MKKILIICLLVIGLGGFAEEKTIPQGGEFGLVVIIQTLNDFFSEMDFLVNPGMGIGVRWHLADFISIDAVVYGGYLKNDYYSGTDSEYWIVGAGVGPFFWFNTSDNFSIFIGPKVSIFLYDRIGSPSQYFRFEIAAILGAQYNFSRHFAVFMDFGAAFVMIQNTDSSSETDTTIFIKALTPAFGAAFYF